MLKDRVKKIWRQIGRWIAKNEKVLLAALAVVIIFSGGFWYRQLSLNDTEQPTVGGTYVEGIVGDQKDLSQITTRLTKSGLLSVSQEGELVPQLVDSWSSNEDKSAFKFVLLDDIDPNEIASVLRERSDLLPTAIINVEEPKTVSVTFDEASPSTPLLMTRPLFDYGPYKLNKTSNQTTIYSRNTKANAVQAYINKIIIHLFKDEASLQSALDRKRLDGAVTSTPQNTDNYQLEEIGLNRYYTVLFNNNKSPFRDQAVRKAVTSGTATSSPKFVLTAPNSEPYFTLATRLIEDWHAKGLSVEAEFKPLSDITGSIGPARNFQALLIGIDYGLDLDPYYLWHSSQVRATGNNITGLNSESIDRSIEAIRSQWNIIQRQKSITELHRSIEETGSAIFLEEEHASFYLSNKIHSVPSYLPKIVADRYMNIEAWSVR